ncbi:MAG TPA: RNA methyltransferase [Candidatus Babeliales bacterium]|nr:RNA methyltransferase [Candidatus Babeliales bacterium]
MATRLGSRAERLTGVSALKTVKGRRERQSFAFEGITLLAEAAAGGFPIAELYATQAVYDSEPLVRRLEADGTPVFLVDDLAVKRISDVTTPSGLVAVAPTRFFLPRELFERGSPILILADLNDPANAGTLLRSADAFGCAGVLFGRLGVDPYHPKVVRGSMGAIFRLALAVADPSIVQEAATRAGVRILGLAAGGAPLHGERPAGRVALIVGHERGGLGRWQSICERLLAIPMSGPAESLSAAVAGSIALYEWACQESLFRPKSQDYRC